MDDADEAEAILLAVGLEDLIPVPEAVETVRRSLGASDPVNMTETVLTSLAAQGKVRLFRGPWDDNDPEEVPEADAGLLLRDPRWYRFHLDEPGEERLYFVNVENLSGP